MRRYRLAQSNAWVYSIQKKTEGNRPGELPKMRREAEIELQAWIMKMDNTREDVPKVHVENFYDYRNRAYIVLAAWTSPTKLHDEGEKT